LRRPRHYASSGLFRSPLIRAAAAASVLVVVGGGITLYLRSGDGPAKSGATPATTASVPATSTTVASGGSATTTTDPAGSFGAIASSLQAGEKVSFDAVYSADSSTGTQSVEYASGPPSNYLFRSSQPGGSVDELIGNSSGTFVCKLPAHSSSWTCLQLPGPASAAYKAFTETYTGAYWYKQMESLSAAATVAGVQHSTSNMVVAGQKLDCVSYSPGSNAGGEVCVTGAGVLGYVHDNSGGTTFRLTSYSTSVAGSLFETPPGAAVSGST
jgi:hypothetical protein